MGLFSTYGEVFERHFSSYSRKETSLYIENRSRVSWNDAFRCKTAASSLLNLRHFSDFKDLACISSGLLPAETPLQLRVLTYNIHHGKGTDGNVDLKLAKHWLLARGEHERAAKLWTFFAIKPIKQLDYIAARPMDVWTLIEVQVIEEDLASDHRPLLAVLKLASASHEVTGARSVVHLSANVHGLA